jgi:hypothetical protein
VAVGLSSDDVEVRRLVELKTFLEERLADLDREMESLKALLELVDRELAARSFKKAPPPEAAEKEEAAALRMIRSRSGTLLATMSLKGEGGEDSFQPRDTGYPGHAALLILPPTEGLGLHA